MQDTIDTQIKNLEHNEQLFKEAAKENIDNYTKAVVDLATSYFSINQIEKAIETTKNSLELLEPLYRENQDEWAEQYTKTLSSLAAYFKISDIDKAIEYEEKSLLIRKKYYAIEASSWGVHYASSLKFLAFIYRSKNEMSKTLQYLQDQYDVLVNIYGKTSENAKTALMKIEKLKENLQK